MSQLSKESEQLKFFFDEQYRLYREPLLQLAERYLNPLLRKRCSAEDVVQSTFETAVERPLFLTSHPEVPLFFKWRTLLFQELSLLERTHLRTQKRAIGQEYSPTEASPSVLFRDIRSAEQSPRGQAVSCDRNRLLLQALESLPHEEYRVVELRQLDGYTAPQCAELLGITLRQVTNIYLRAMRHLKLKLERRSEFCCP